MAGACDAGVRRRNIWIFHSLVGLFLFIYAILRFTKVVDCEKNSTIKHIESSVVLVLGATLLAYHFFFRIVACKAKNG